MKNLALSLFLLLFLILLSSCKPGQIFGPTMTTTPIETPTQTATFTPANTSTETPTSTNTPNMTATYQASIPKFYSGAAPTLDQFPLVEKTDIPRIIAYLHTQPTLLSKDATPPQISNQIGNNYGNLGVFVDCNSSNIVNCAPAATIQYKDKVNEKILNIYIMILEIKTKNTSDGRGYITDYIYSSEAPGLYGVYELWQQEPKAFMTLHCLVGIAEEWKLVYPYENSLTQQPGLIDAIKIWMSDDIITPELEQMVIHC